MTAMPVSFASDGSRYASRQEADAGSVLIRSLLCCADMGLMIIRT